MEAVAQTSHHIIRVWSYHLEHGKGFATIPCPFSRTLLRNEDRPKPFDNKKSDEECGTIIERFPNKSTSSPNTPVLPQKSYSDYISEDSSTGFEKTSATYTI
jgi:hypothetical protein